MNAKTLSLCNEISKIENIPLHKLIKYIESSATKAELGSNICAEKVSKSLARELHDLEHGEDGMCDIPNSIMGAYHERLESEIY